MTRKEVLTNKDKEQIKSKTIPNRLTVVYDSIVVRNVPKSQRERIHRPAPLSAIAPDNILYSCENCNRPPTLTIYTLVQSSLAYCRDKAVAYCVRATQSVTADTDTVFKKYLGICNVRSY